MRKTLLTAALAAGIFGIPVAQAQDTVKIGALYNLTGGMSSIDAPALYGAQLAAKLINEKGGVNGQKIEIVSIDTKTDQQAAALGAKNVLSSNVIAGIGYGDTTFVMAAAPLFEEKKIPFVTSGATHPELPAWVGEHMFMVPFGDDDQSFAIADHAYGKLNVRNVAVWTDQSMDFTKALSKFFVQRMKERGAKITLEDSFQMGDKDFSAQIARLKAANPKPDAVFVSAIPNEAGITVKQIREAGLDLPIVSGDGFDTELVSTVPGEKFANKVYFSTHTYRADDRPEVQAFVDAYKKGYNREPENAFAALGYDAVGLIADALKRAGKNNPAALTKALSETKSFGGVTGVVAYTRPSRVPAKPVAIIGLENGKYSVRETWTPKN